MHSILVVDDDDLIRDMLRQMLEWEHYDVYEAANGKEAVRLFAKTPVDLIITDLIMPEQEGIETIKQLKNKSPNIKIIAMSGGGVVPAKVYLEIANALGAEKTFEKPIDRDELVDAVKQLLMD